MESTLRIALELVARDLSGGAFGSFTGNIMRLSGLLGGFASTGANGATAALGELLLATAAAGLAFAAFLVPTKAAIDAGTVLQFTLAQVGIAVDGARNAMPQLTNAVIDMADHTMYSSDQVGQAFVALGEHGFNASQIVYGTGASFDALAQKGYQAGQAVNGLAYQALFMSEAMHIDATQGANLLGQALQVFSDQGLTAGNVADMLTAAFYHGMPSADGMSSALANVGGIADSMHIKFADLLTVLDILSPRMGSTSMAATSLRYFLSTLADPTVGHVKAELSDLGLLTVNETTPAFRKFADALVAAGGASSDQLAKWKGSVAGLQDMFKAAQAVGLVPLDKSFNSWATDAGFMNNKFYDTKGNFIGLKGSLDLLMQSMEKHKKTPEEMAMAIGDLFNVRSSQGARILLNMLGQFDPTYAKIYAQVTKVGTAQKAQQDLNSTLLGSWTMLKTTFTSFLAEAIMPLIPGLTQVVRWLNQLLSAAMQHPKLMMFIGVVLLLGTVIFGITFVVLAAITVFTIFGAVVGGLFAPVLIVVAIIVALIAIIILLVTHWKLVQQVAGNVWSWIQARVGDAVSWIGTQLNHLGLWFVQTWDNIKAGVTNALHNIQNTVNSIFGAVVSFFVNGIHRIGDFFGWLYNHNYYWHDLVDLINRLIHGLMTWLHNTWNAIVTDATRAWQWVQQHIVTPVQHAVRMVQERIEWAKNFLNMQWAAIQVRVDAAWRQFTNTIANALGTVKTNVSNIVSAILQPIQNLGGQLVQAGENLMHMLAQGIQNAAGAVGNAVSGVASNIWKFLGFHSPSEEGPGHEADQWMPNLMKMLSSTMLHSMPTLRSAVGQVAMTVSGVVSPATQAAQTGNALAVAQSSGSVQEFTINIPIDKKTVARAVFQVVGGQLRQNGLSRINRG